MHLAVTADQQLLIDSARGFLARACPIAHVRAMEHDTSGYDPAVWRQMAALGWLSGDVEGSGQSFVDLVLLVEEMGRVLLPSPFLPTVVLAAPLLARMPSAARWLEPIAAGELVATAALLDPEGHDEWQAPILSARSDANGVVLDGRKRFVPFATSADLILLTATPVPPPHQGGGTGEVAPLIVALTERNDPGIECTHLDTLSGEPLHEVTLRNVVVPREHVMAAGPAAQNAIASTRERGAVAMLAYLAGAAERVLEMTVDYAKTRTQFGKPIGSFQAIAHRCVDMRSDIDALRLLVHQAAWCLAERQASTLAVSAAKAYGNEALRRIFMHAHQVHGAIGFSTEHDLHLFTRRAKAAELLWGSTDRHLEQVARAMGL